MIRSCRHSKLVKSILVIIFATTLTFGIMESVGFATIPGEWQRVSSFGNYFDFKLVGLGTTNSRPGGA